jgi:hypothetical protein
MAVQTHEAIARLWQKFLQAELTAMPPEERAKYEQAFQDRGELLLENAAADGQDGFLDLIGFSGKGVQPFKDMPHTYLKPDFDEAVVPTQLHSAAQLYFIYQHERMKVFQVADVLRRLFEQGRIRVNQGPGARELYLLEKWRPLRYGSRDRMVAYRRVFNYGTVPAPPGALVNRNFHRQMVAFMTALAQYFRDLLIGEVIRGGQLIEQRPFASIATVQRLGVDLRYALDRSSYGNVFALTEETAQYLKTVLDLMETPDVKKAFDAQTKWEVVEVVSNRYLGGMAELSQRAKMAESGRKILMWVTDNDFRTDVDAGVFQSFARPFGNHAEAWIAAYRMTSEGRGYQGVAPTLRRLLGGERVAA